MSTFTICYPPSPSGGSPVSLPLYSCQALGMYSTGPCPDVHPAAEVAANAPATLSYSFLWRHFFAFVAERVHRTLMILLRSVFHFTTTLLSDIDIQLVVS